MTELARLRLADREYTGWTALTVTRSLEAIASTWAVSATSQGDTAQLGIPPGTPCELVLGDTVVCRGHVERCDAAYDATSRSVTLQGRSLTGDLVDCSVLHPSGQWRGASVRTIAAELVAPYGVELVCEDTTTVPRFAAEWGEPVADALHRLARLRGHVLTDDTQGRLVLGPLVTASAETALELGGNILAGQGSFDGSGRYSVVRVQGARLPSGADAGLPTVQVEGSATDPTVTRRRELVIPGDAALTPELASRRALWEQASRAARATALGYTVQGWRQRPGGALWAPGLLVQVCDRLLGVDAQFVVSELTHSLDANGSITTLALASPAAWVPEPLADPSPARKGKAKDTQGVGPWAELEGGI